ncbi:peptidylprolyl isomerase [Novosphingobium piscinae]|uniref:Peptidylprolyl isomerase n=1 Tax=Novosphingobium piscinae TaxID=1507448 RepID=A0A7X1FZN7_9SPHN|nr:peptidylprolyl isomerase [Novosphingobium piscinae]MBC2669948.1 peptidylprolyl isomerase [Novosphingobium piscinae]
MPTPPRRTARSAPLPAPVLRAAALLVAAAAPAQAATPVPTPAEIVAAAPADDWAAIAADDLLVMDLAPDAAGQDRPGRPRRVVIQLLPEPFARPWIANLRQLATAGWWDGLSVNRVQDNYVVQWGDAEAEDKAKARPLPAGLSPTTEQDYAARWAPGLVPWALTPMGQTAPEVPPPSPAAPAAITAPVRDAYAAAFGFRGGFPVALGYPEGPPKAWKTVAPVQAWPIHCYGTVGVGRNMPPDAGTGAELYAVIGTPPRHLDRNIAVVGRVIEGIEHLSSLPRGTGPLGFYQSAAERTAIRTIRLGSAVPDLPRYQALSTAAASFARYVEARANRRDTFFVKPAGGVDICNLPVPVRRAP